VEEEHVSNHVSHEETPDEDIPGEKSNRIITTQHTKL
jgi:hypothetical protein